MLILFKDELITAIHNDIKESNAKLDLPQNEAYKSDEFFSIPA